MSSAEHRRAVQVRLSAPPTERLSELQRTGQWRRNTNCLQKEIFLNRAPAVRDASLSECGEGQWGILQVQVLMVIQGEHLKRNHIHSHEQ